MSSASSTHRSGLLAVAVSGVAFGTLAIFGKAAARRGIPLAELLALRFLVAATALWVVLLIRRERLWPGRRIAAGVSLMGLLYVGQASAYFTSLRTVPAAVTSVLLYLYPVIVMVGARILLSEPVTRGRAAAMALAVAGVVLVVDPFGTAGHVDPAGVVFGVLCAAVYAVYIVAGPRLIGGASALLATAYIATVAGVAFLVAAVLTGGLKGLDAGRIELTVGMGVVATVIPATLFLVGLARIGPTRSAIVSTLEPLTTAVLAAAFLGERLGVVRLVGGVAVLAAAVIIALDSPAALVAPPVRD